MNTKSRGTVAGMGAAVGILVTGLLLAGCVTDGAKEKVPPVTVGDIIRMSTDGTPPAAIIAKIRESGTVYRMKASELAKLKAQGVSDDVIDQMQNTYLNAIGRDQHLRDEYNWTLWNDGYWYGGMPFGWPYGPYWYETEVIREPVHERHNPERVHMGSRMDGSRHHTER